MYCDDISWAELLVGARGNCVKLDHNNQPNINRKDDGSASR